LFQDSLKVQMEKFFFFKEIFCDIINDLYYHAVINVMLLLHGIYMHFQEYHGNTTTVLVCLGHLINIWLSSDK